MNKKVLTISLIIGLSVVAITTATLTTYFVSKKKNEERVNELYKAAFEMHYNDRVNLFKEENKHATNVDVVFLGDSLTEGYDLTTYYPEYNVLNRGIGGDTTFGVEKRLKESVYDANPKITAMLIGANNFDTMLDNYENILIDFKDKAPTMKVILLSLTSMTGNWGRNNEKAKKNNVEIEKYSSKYGYSYVNLYDPLLDSNTNELNINYTTDGGHLTPQGYEVVTSQIKPVIANLLA